MAARPERRPRRRDRSITAAGIRLETSQSDQGASAIPKRTDEGWKKEAWACYHAVGEIKFATRFRANSLARLRLFPAIRVTAGDDPIPVDEAAALKGDGTEPDEPVAPLSPQQAQVCADEFDRLAHTPGGMAELQRSYGVHMTIPGESNLIGWDDEATGGERWAMLPETCVKAGDRAGIYTVTHPDTGTEFQIDASADGPDFAARLWLRDEEKPWKSDSNLRSALDIVEELLIYQRSLRGTGKSRSSAGLLGLPTELDLEPVAPVEEVDDDDPDNVVALNPDEGPDGFTDFERGIIQSFVQPTQDDGTAASVAPHIIRGPADALKGIVYLSLARTIDPQVLERIQHLIERLAHALDVPVEVIEGIGDANHWTAWFIDDTTYKAHIEPLAQMLADDLARVFLRPAIIAGGVPAELAQQVVIGIDPAGLVVRPNRVTDAEWAYEHYELSGDALRRHMNFADSDKPDDEEIARRVEIAAGLHARAAVEAPPGAEAPTPAQPNPPAPEKGGEPSGAGGGDSSPSDNPGGGQGGGDAMPSSGALVAAGAGVSDLGQRLAGIDQRLAARLQTAASAELSAVLARAGQRLRAAVQGDPTLAAAAKGVPNAQVGAVVGPGHVSGADLVSAADFDALHSQWTDWTGQARSQAIAAVRAEGERRDLDTDAIDGAIADMQRTLTHDQDSGWAVLLSSLLELGRNRVYSPDATPDRGEFDPHLSVPMGVVRRALGTMGDGGLAGADGPGSSSGPATGQSMLGLGVLTALGASTIAYQWNWGGGANPFPPHADLDGIIVTGPDDAQLAYSEWPADGGYLTPGDHDGCSCSLDPIIVFGGLDDAEG